MLSIISDCHHYSHIHVNNCLQLPDLSKHDWTGYVWRLGLASVPTSDSIKIECNVATAQSTLL